MKVNINTACLPDGARARKVAADAQKARKTAVRMGRVPRVRVAGGGLTGLAAAVLLLQRGARVELWEPAPRVGGLLAPVPFHGLRMDVGSHRVLPEAHHVLAALCPEVAWEERPRRGMLVMGRRQAEYPLRLFPFLAGLGVRRSAQLGAAWLTRPGAWDGFLRWEAERARVDVEDVGFSAFVRGRAGQAALDAFYAPYARKVWGVDPDVLSQTVAKQRVSTSRPWRSILGGAASTFFYPRGGVATLLDVLERSARALGLTTVPKAFALTNADDVPTIFTGHLGGLAGEPGLTHRGLYLLHLLVRMDRASDVDTWYVPDGAYVFGRVSQVQRFSPGLTTPEGTVLCVEVPQGEWGTQQDFLERLPQVTAQLRQAHILGAQDVVLDARQTFVPDVYPLCTRGWRHAWARAVHRVTSEHRVFPVGRQGLFLHCNMDHCVEMAGAVTNHVLAGHSAPAWAQHARGYLDLRVRD